MGLTVTEDTPADMLAGNMELLVQLPPRIDDDYDNDEIYDGDDVDHVHQQHRNNHRNIHHNHHHSNGHHQRRNVNGNARRVTVARSTPMMDLLVQVATSQKLSASSYTLEAIGEHGLVLTHHPNTPIGALDALQVKLLPKQGTFLPMKTRHVNQPFEQTFRLQVHLPRNQLYVSRVSSKMNLGKILDDVCREKNLDRNNYELCHPANIEEVLDLSLSLQDYHLQEVTLCPKRRSLSSSLSTQDIMALQRQEERRRQEAKQSVFGFAFKKSKESSLSTDSLGERSVSPARSDGTGRSASPQAPTVPTRPLRKRRPAPKPPMPRVEPEVTKQDNIPAKDVEENDKDNAERIMVISHSRNSSDSSGYHEASVLSDNLDSNIRVPETLPRRSRPQTTLQESPGRTLAESSQASKSLSNLAVVPRQRATTIARGNSNSSLISAGLRKKKAAPAPPPPRPLSLAISNQGLERIVDSEESLTSVSESLTPKASSDVSVASERTSLNSTDQSTALKNDIEVMKMEDKIQRREESPRYSPSPEIKEDNISPMDDSSSCQDVAESPIVPNLEPAKERKRAIGVTPPVPKPRGTIGRLEKLVQIRTGYEPPQESLPPSKKLVQKITTNLYHPVEEIPRINKSQNDIDNDGKRYTKNSHESKYHHDHKSPRPMPRHETEDRSSSPYTTVDGHHGTDVIKVPEKPRRKPLEKSELVTEVDEKSEEPKEETETVKSLGIFEKLHNFGISKVEKSPAMPDEKISEENRRLAPKTAVNEKRKAAPTPPPAAIGPKDEKVYLMNGENDFEVTPSGRVNGGVKKSCAVISTIPKCDNFQDPGLTKITAVGEDDLKRLGDDGGEFNLIMKMDTSLGSSFGAGKSILDKNYQRDLESIGSSSVTTEFTNSETTDDELELESFEMFEESRKPKKLSNLLRSHSEFNNFEINTFGGNRRPLTSTSEDFTFALNPHLARNISDLSTDAYPRKFVKKNSRFTGTTSKAKRQQILHSSITEIPAFLASSITWEKQELLQAGIGDRDPSPSHNASTIGESGPTSDAELGISSTAEKSKSEVESPTSDLLKKVSDTLSGSLRSPIVTGQNLSLVNEEQLVLNGNAHCMENKLGSRDEDSIRVNEAKQHSDVNENTIDNNNRTEFMNEERRAIDPIDPNFLNNSQPPKIKEFQHNSTTSDSMQNTISNDIDLTSNTNDWQYILPEPPTAFRDANEVDEKREIFSKISSSKTVSNSELDIVKSVADSNTDLKPALQVSRSTVKSRGIEVVTNGTTLERKSSSVRYNENGGSRSRTTSGSSEIGSDLGIEKGRLSRTGIKFSPVDTESRRGSQASYSSTPSIAPVDNTLSNFVITTYSKPKNVDIFNEIEQVREVPNLNRKHSTTSSSSSVNLSPQKPEVLQKSNASSESQRTEKIVNEIIPHNEGDLLNNAVNRSNIKISIATKPRPRGDSMNEKQRPKSVFVKIGEDRSSDSKEEGKSGEEISRESIVGGNKKFSQWRENILNKQENPTTEKQLQSLQVLRSILPQLDGTEKNPGSDSSITVKTDSNPSEETRAAAPLPDKIDPPTETNLQNSTVSSSNEQQVKRYSYAGPPAINLGSWSDRSQTARVQIKPDKDYKFEKSRSPEIEVRKTPSFRKDNLNTTANNVTVTNITSVKNPGIEKELNINNRDNKREPNELARTLITRTTASGFKRPVSMSFEPSTMIIRSKKEEEDIPQKLNGERETTLQKRFGTGIRGNEISTKEDKFDKEEEIDTRPRNFKELKEAFAKDQNTNTISMPKFGTFGRRSDNSTAKPVVRRDSNLSSNGEDVNTLRRDSQEAVPVQEKRNFVVVPPSNNRNNGIHDAVRKTSRTTLMPVVKGFKIAGANEDEKTSSQEKRTGFTRVAIGDISNGNYVQVDNGLRKTSQVKIEDFSKTVPKPPTMPVITGVTLKSTNHNNTRPKSMPVEADPRNMLLESIRNFGGQNQLRRAPKRNTNIVGTAVCSRSVRS